MIDEGMIILIIGLAGLLGGTTNYFLNYDSKLKTTDCWIKFGASVFLSICAAITVPLFLQILSNNLLDTLSLKNTLIFAGFCILAAFFSHRFLHDLYSQVRNLKNKVEQQQRETRSVLQQSDKKAQEINKKVEELEESIEEVDVSETPAEIKSILEDNKDLDLTDDAIQKFLGALLAGKYALRTIDGLSRETKISKEKIKSILVYLKYHGFVEERISSNGKTFFRLLKNAVRVYSANYGVIGRFTDVTANINELLAKGINYGVATQAFLNVDDPAPGVKKVLKIHYRIQGKEKELIRNEGESFRIE
jgi:hypothetical protein